MEDILYPEELSKKLQNIQNIAIKNKYGEVLTPINELIEYLENINLPNKTCSNEIDFKKDKVQILAYYLSRFDHYDIFPNLNQNEALEKISAMLNIKKTTLRLARDYFDSKISKIKLKESPYLKLRKGIDMPLSKQAEKIYNYYLHRKKTEITKDILMILKENNATTN